MWNKQELANISKRLKCQGSKVLRRKGSDTDVVYSAAFPLHVGLPFKIENSESAMLQVLCFVKDNAGRQELMYSYIHLLTKLPSSNHKPLTEDKLPGVLILLIESLARVNGEKQLPQTVRVLRELYNATLLRGLTKVGDNTFPNLVALLTGHGVGRRGGKEHEGEQVKEKNIDVDQLPFLWNSWRDLGCPTLYSEDSPAINTFTYLRRGFSLPPTTVYHRPWWLAVGRLPRRNRHNTTNEPYGCTLGKPSYTHQRDLAINFLRQTRHQCSFSLVFHVALGHTTDINDVAVMDNDLANWLRLMHTEGLVQDKLVLVGGDHGNRFSGSRLSLGGRVEERMPFMAVSLPRKLQGGGKLMLEENKDKLVSHFDLHRTILSLLPSPPDDPDQVETQHTPISLLTPIPNNRTCSEAGVPTNYCVCTPERYLSLRHPEAGKAVEALVDKVEDMLKPHQHLCMPVGLSRLLEARLVGEEVRVTILTTTKATLEALVKGGKEVVGDINRLDYMGTKVCLSDSYLQLFCTCRSSLPQIFGG